MTRKDYVKAAKIIAAARVRYPWAIGDYRKEVVDYFETELSDMFAADSPRFDRQRFLKACQPTEPDSSKHVCSDECQ